MSVDGRRNENAAKQQVWSGTFLSPSSQRNCVEEIYFDDVVSLTHCSLSYENSKRDETELEEGTHSTFLQIFAKSLEKNEARFQQIGHLDRWKEASVIRFHAMPTHHIVIRGSYTRLSISFFAEPSFSNGYPLEFDFAAKVEENQEDIQFSLAELGMDVKSFPQLTAEGEDALKSAVASFKASGKLECDSSSSILLIQAIHGYRNARRKAGKAIDNSRDSGSAIELTWLENAAAMAAKWLQKLILPTPNSKSRLTIDSQASEAAMAAARLLCLHKYGRFQLVMQGALKPLIHVLSKPWNAHPRIQLAALEALNSATAEAYICHVLLDWWNPEVQERGAQGPGEGYRGLLEALVSGMDEEAARKETENGDETGMTSSDRYLRLLIVRESAEILSRLHVVEVAFRCQQLLDSAVFSAHNSLLTRSVGRLALLLPMLHKSLASSAPSKDSVDRFESLLPAMRMLDAAGFDPTDSDSFKPFLPFKRHHLAPEFCQEHLALLRESEVLQYLAAFLSHPAVVSASSCRSDSFQPAMESTMAAITHLLLSLLHSHSGLSLLAQDWKSTRNLLKSLNLHKVEAREGAQLLTVSNHLMLSQHGVSCQPGIAARLLEQHVTAMEAANSFVSAPLLSDAAGKALRSMAEQSMEVNKAGFEAVMSVMGLPQVSNRVMESFQLGSQLDIKSPAQWEALSYITHLLLHSSKGSGSFFIDSWASHATDLWQLSQKLLQSAYPCPGNVGPTALSLCQLSEACHWPALYQSRGVSALLQGMLDLSDELKEKQPGQLAHHVCQLSHGMSVLIGLSRDKSLRVAMHGSQVLYVLQDVLHYACQFLLCLPSSDASSGSAAEELLHPSLLLLSRTFKLLLPILHHIKEEGLQYSNTAMVDSLLELLGAINGQLLPGGQLSPMNPPSTLTDGTSLLSVDIRLALSAALSFWILPCFAPEAIARLQETHALPSLHSYLPAAERKSTLGPRMGVSLLTLLCDLLPVPANYAEKHSASGYVLPAIAMAVTLREATPQLLQSLEPYSDMISTQIAFCVMSSCRVGRGTVGRLLLSAASLDAHWAARLAQPLLRNLKIRDAGASTQADKDPVFVTAQQLSQTLEIVEELSFYAEAKEMLLQQGTFGALLSILSSPLTSEDSCRSILFPDVDFRLPVNEQHKTLCLSILSNLSSPTPESNASKSTKKRKVNSEQRPSFSECSKFASVISAALLEIDPDSCWPYLAAVASLASHSWGQASLIGAMAGERGLFSRCFGSISAKLSRGIPCSETDLSSVRILVRLLLHLVSAAIAGAAENSVLSTSTLVLLFDLPSSGASDHFLQNLSDSASQSPDNRWRKIGQTTTHLVDALTSAPIPEDIQLSSLDLGSIYSRSASHFKLQAPRRVPPQPVEPLLVPWTKMAPSRSLQQEAEEKEASRAMEATPASSEQQRVTQVGSRAAGAGDREGGGYGHSGGGRPPSIHVDEFMARQKQQGVVLVGAPTARPKEEPKKQPWVKQEGGGGTSLSNRGQEQSMAAGEAEVGGPTAGRQSLVLSPLPPSLSVTVPVSSSSPQTQLQMTPRGPVLASTPLQPFGGDRHPPANEPFQQQRMPGWNQDYSHPTTPFFRHPPPGQGAVFQSEYSAAMAAPPAMQNAGFQSFGRPPVPPPAQYPAQGYSQQPFFNQVGPTQGMPPVQMPLQVPARPQALPLPQTMGQIQYPPQVPSLPSDLGPLLQSLAQLTSPQGLRQPLLQPPQQQQQQVQKLEPTMAAASMADPGVMEMLLRDPSKLQELLEQNPALVDLLQSRLGDI